jgi:hypothetical protein
MMNFGTKTMDMMSMNMPGMDMKMMQDCMEACSAAEQASTMCADAASGDQMGKMGSMCASTADLCNSMMRMMMRPMGFDMGAMKAMLDATATMCRACAEQCMTHADMSDDAKMCAQVCQNCASACEALAGSMKPESMSSESMNSESMNSGSMNSGSAKPGSMNSGSMKPGPMNSGSMNSEATSSGA